MKNAGTPKIDERRFSGSDGVSVEGAGAGFLARTPAAPSGAVPAGPAGAALEDLCLAWAAAEPLVLVPCGCSAWTCGGASAAAPSGEPAVLLVGAGASPAAEPVCVCVAAGGDGVALDVAGVVAVLASAAWTAAGAASASAAALSAGNRYRRAGRRVIVSFAAEQVFEQQAIRFRAFARGRVVGGAGGRAADGRRARRGRVARQARCAVLRQHLPLSRPGISRAPASASRL